MPVSPAPSCCRWSSPICGPAGETPAVFYSARTGKVEVLCGQGCTPAGATLERYRAEGLSLIPGNGLLATVIPGAFDAWMLLLRDHGTMRLRDVLEPAIYYAEHGHALMPRISNTIAGLGFLPDPLAVHRRDLPARRRGARGAQAVPQSGAGAHLDAAADGSGKRGRGPRAPDRSRARRVLPGLRGRGHRRLCGAPRSWTKAARAIAAC